MKLSKLMTVVVVALAATKLAANDIWVDAANYGLPNLDGTEAKAFGTIQDAVESAAASGDVIYVRPGVYDKGYGVDGGGTTNRVCIIDKNVRIEATGTKEDTHIVGWKDPSGNNGMSPAAIRCVFVKSDTGSIVKGFTIRDGATACKTPSGSNSDTTPYRGGGYSCSDTAAKNHNYLVDCVVSNCAAGYGGAIAGGMAIRCLFTDNYGGIEGAVQRRGYAWNCVMTRNTGAVSDTRIVSRGNAAHCTIMGNGVGGVVGASGVSSYIYNCLIFGNNGGDDHIRCTMEGNSLTSDGVIKTGSVLDDFRVLSGSHATTCAIDAHKIPSTETFDEIPAEFAGKDFYGNPFPSASGPLCAGAVQETFTPAYGAVYVPGSRYTPGARPCSLVVDGVSCPFFYYAFARTYPEQHHLKMVSSPGYLLTHVNQLCGTLVPSFNQVPTRAGDLSIMPAPDAGSIITNTINVVTPGATLWVDDDNYGKAGLDGSTEEKAFGTIQDAVAAASANTLIKVKPGTYDRGGALSAGLTNRVYCASAKAPLFIESTDGAEATVIVGAADPNTHGVGSGAIRCAAFSGIHHFRGFTLTGAYSTNVSGGEAPQGTAYRSSAADMRIVECVISNNVSIDTIVQYGTMTRCRLVGNRAPCISYLTSFNACLVSGNGPRSGTSCNVLSKVTAHHSTVAGNSGNLTANATSSLINSIVQGTGSDAAKGAYASSLLWNFTSYGDATGSFLTENPYFAVAEDFRPLAFSAAFTRGADLAAANPEAAWRYATLDLDGNPVKIDGGRIVIGAYHTPSSASVVYVDVTSGDLSITGGSVGYNALTSEGVMALSPGEASRPIAGVTVNGATNLFADAEGASISIAAAHAAGGVMVKAIYTTDWYVDDDGSDENSGFAPNDAKQTFEKLFATGKVVSGDTVHVLPGRYESGAMAVGSEELKARLTVPSGVTVVSTEGAERTVIVGKTADAEEAYVTGGVSYYNGCGVGAMHAVKLESNAKLIGFTVTGGRTRAVSGNYHYSKDWIGGGILGYAHQNADYPTSYAAECIISNNVAFRGGAARDVTLVNCRILDNISYYGGSAISDGSLFGCYVQGNADRVSNNRAVFNYSQIVNCTLMDDISNPLSASSRILNTYMHKWKEQNKDETGNTVICSNCVYRSESNPTAAKINESCAIAPESNLLFENGRPVAGANACIDFADSGYLYAIASEKDASLGARVTNGRLDVGAFEANWLPRYSSDIGRRFSVTAATSGVVESKTTGKVEIGDGESIEGFLANPSGKPDACRIKFAVYEGASAVITVNGVETTYSSAGVHEHCFSGAAEGDVVLIAAVCGTVVVDSAGRGGFVLIYR